jgi:hypothetical protein
VFSASVREIDQDRPVRFLGCAKPAAGLPGERILAVKESQKCQIGITWRGRHTDPEFLP